jgi:signal transduction histidine kinase
MRKVALVFVVAVLAPSLVLAWLAVRSLRDQQLILERQRYLLCQGVADKLADMAGNFLADQQAGFRNQVEALLAQQNTTVAPQSFDQELRAHWPLAQIGFVVTMNGILLCPSPASSPAAQSFCLLNAKFLGNQESAQVYLNSKMQINSASQQFRNVVPQQQGLSQPAEPQAPSKVSWSQTEFRQLMGDAMEGALARFLDNQLNVMFWYRSPRNPQLVFGAQLDPARLRESLGRLPAAVELAPPLQQEIGLAILNDAAKPVGLSTPGFAANWKKPFVATEIGETLPHWEAAVYLIDTAALSKSAAALKLTLGLLIAVLVIAIGVGGWLILRDVASQLILARQKTDFVSNVSHELKTPLTAIRMFAELLAEGRVPDAAKQRSYLAIITAEASRLTRLINNVLDFSCLERGEKKYHLQPCDLAEVARAAALTFRPHLETAGLAFDCSLPETALPVRGDPDALAQIIVNLLSNAEKYSNGRKEIQIRVRRTDAPAPLAEVMVLDRGAGVPRGGEEKIFEKFYRAHDSLGSGIEGSGLGLTLARQMARAHGGDVVYEPREGGGSCFSLRLPLAAPPP